MKALREFFNLATIVKCLVFSMIVSLLYLARFDYVKHVPFFSNQSLKNYIGFTIVNFFLFIIIFLVLFLLARRAQKES